MKHFKTFHTLSSVILVLVFISCQQADYYPGETWNVIENPEKIGYSSEKLEEAKAYSNSISTAAVVILVDGRILSEWGEVSTKFMTHSTRKSFLSAMYGNYVRNGIIDLDKSLKDIGIDDDPPLSEEELEATIRDCIKARSGIYHPALYESPGMKALKPERYTEKPGIHWYYNNWDFNVLGTVFEKLTGKKIFEALYEEIAIPIGMEDFSPEDGWYVNGEESIHAAYPFRITARDMARFGLLMLRKGKWIEEQVVPEDWVEESTAYYSDATLYSYDGYGYMWWVARQNNKFSHLPGVDLEDGTFSARGAGGHYIIVIPDRNMVIVHRVNTDVRENSVSSSEMGQLVDLILRAVE